jgi:hypothetical protein
MSSIRAILLRLLPAKATATLAGLRAILSGDYLHLRRALIDNRRRAQMASAHLAARYPQLDIRPAQPDDLRRHELSVYSQNGEDGILLHLFSLVGAGAGAGDHTIVEFGVGDGSECNAANLLINFGWTGLLMEADERRAEQAAHFYWGMLKERAADVAVLHQAVTVHNINELIAGQGIAGEIALLSIDVDGNDYWLWRALTVIQPRIVVIEYNASLGAGAGRSITTPYDPYFNRYAKHSTGFYHGASLTALTRLAEEKGYILAGCESAGVNAFFVRADIADGKVPPIAPAAAYRPHMHRSRTRSPEAQWQAIQHLPFVEV